MENNFFALCSVELEKQVAHGIRNGFRLAHQLVADPPDLAVRIVPHPTQEQLKPVYFFLRVNLLDGRMVCRPEVGSLEIISVEDTLSRYLQGVREPELKYVVRLARYFGVSVDWLLGLSNDRYEAVPTEVREFATLYALASPDDRTIVETVLKKYREEN